jgi:hypothetical protein
MQNSTGASDDREGLAPFSEVPHDNPIPRQVALDDDNEHDGVQHEPPPDAERRAREPAIACLVLVLVTHRAPVLSIDLLQLVEAFSVVNRENAGLYQIIRMRNPIVSEGQAFFWSLRTDPGFEPKHIHATDVPFNDGKPNISTEDCHPCQSLCDDRKSHV